MRKLNIVFLILVSIACSDQKIDTTKAREGLKSQEIQVVSDADILEKAMEIGKQDLKIESISLGENGTLNIRLAQTSKYNPNEVFFAFEQANPLEGKSKEVFEAYAYNHENDLASSPNVQFGEEKQFIIYTAPVVFDGSEVGIFLVQIPRKDIVLTFAD
uniref:hypothetical protein n=1 Tax=Roseivirga sp. TaxID=1964215 RepID=UPI00404755E6